MSKLKFNLINLLIVLVVGGFMYYFSDKRNREIYKKICAEYPYITLTSEIDGYITYILDPLSIGVKNGPDINVIINDHKISIFACENGDLSKSVISDVARVGDRIIKKANNDTLLIIQNYENDTVVLKLIVNEFKP